MSVFNHAIVHASCAPERQNTSTSLYTYAPPCISAYVKLQIVGEKAYAPPVAMWAVRRNKKRRGIGESRGRRKVPNGQALSRRFPLSARILPDTILTWYEQATSTMKTTKCLGVRFNCDKSAAWRNGQFRVSRNCRATFQTACVFNNL